MTARAWSLKKSAESSHYALFICRPRRAGNLAFFDGGGVRLMLTPPEKPQFDHPGSILYFNLPDIKAAYGRMLASGVRFQDEPHLIARMPNHDL